VAFIRRVRTGSGATAVQIAEYVSGRRQRIVAHLGSAHSEVELGLLMARAQGMLDDAAQGELDLGLAEVRRRHRLAPSPPDPALFPPVAAPQAAGPPRAASRARRAVETVAAGSVVGTASGLLFDLLAGVYSSLGFDELADEVFRDLVITRVVEPTSMLDVGRVLADMGRTGASYSTLQRTLRRAARTADPDGIGPDSTGLDRGEKPEKSKVDEPGRAEVDDGPAGVCYRDRIADLCFAHALSSGDVSLVLYDVTTLYFEAEKEDGLRKVGFSKERRVDPQIVVGLLVDRNGFPLEIGCFEGNKAEKLTIVPIIEAFHSRHRIENMIVVADAGMLSAANLTTLDEAGFRFIVGARQSKAPIDLESHFAWHGDQAARRTRLGPDSASGGVAGGLGLLGQAVRPRQPHVERPGDPGPSRGRGRVVGADPEVRQEQRRRPDPRREGPRPRSTPGRAQGLRHQPARRWDARE
jgi:hypothetical protein